MTTTEKSILIAEFMGGVYNDSPQRLSKFDIPKDSIWLPIHNMSRLSRLQYNTSWDWLMPVVDKIERLGYRTDIFKADDSDTHLCQVWTHHAERSQLVSTAKEWSRTKIEAVYGAVVQFIQWYNQNK